MDICLGFYDLQNQKIMRLVLLGYMGSGKSSIGKKLARALRLKFIDLDQYIEEKESASIAQLFKEKGEIYFRTAEHERLNELLRTQDNFVLALGGGTPCYAGNIELINKEATSIYLKCSIKQLERRLKRAKSKRPLIADVDDDKLSEFIAKHLFERAPFYEQASITVDANQLQAKVVEEISSRMRQPPSY